MTSEPTKKQSPKNRSLKSRYADLSKNEHNSKIISLCNLIKAKKHGKLLEELKKLGDNGDKNATRFLGLIESDFTKGTHSIISDGNTKLPYPSFSLFPVVSCPGMGDCKYYCYSLKTALIRPTFSYRLLINYYLLTYKKDYLIENIEFYLKHKKPKFFRFFVDGDFDSFETIKMFSDLAAKFKNTTFFGYTKSYILFVSYCKKNKLPDNFVLNASSDINKKNSTFLNDFLKIPNVRGEFQTIKTSNVVRKYKEGGANHESFIRNLLTVKGKTDIICKGYCGSCGGASGIPWCANKRIKNRIVIGLH